MVNGPGEQDPDLALEIAGLEVDQAQAVHAHLGELRNRLNVYRGHVLDVAVAPDGGGVMLEFGDVPATGRDDVVLPESVLGRVERHAWGWPLTATRCSAPASTSSADCSCTGRRAPARPTPSAT